MGLYVGNTRVSPVIMATPIYRGSYNIVTDLGLTVDALESDIITTLTSEISTPQYANYCFVDIPYSNYSDVSGYDQFTTTSDYVGYYVLIGDAYTLVTADNKDTLSIIAGTTVAYSVSYTSYFEKIQRYRYNGNGWEYEYDVDFSGYANVDASNFTDSGTTFLSGLGMPDVTRVELLSSSTMSSGIEFTAPANGWFYAQGTVSTQNTYNINIRYIDNLDYMIRYISFKNYQGGSISEFAPVHTGTRVSINWQSFSANQITILFIYAEGNPTPPQP